MKILKLALLSFALTALVLRAEPSPVCPPSATVDSLAEALPILQAKYPDFPALNYKPGDKLSDLIARSEGKISLTALEETTPTPIMITSLPDGVVYWRLASFSPEKSWLDLAKQAEQAAPTAVGVVLDLRSNVAPDDYAGAGQMLAWFASGDATLSEFGVPGVAIDTRSSFHAPMVVLTNGQTCGAAEALAACLQADGALVIGRPTAGRMGIFQEQKLSSGQVLRYFVSPVGHLPTEAALTISNHHPVDWGQTVTPDIGVTVDDRTEKAALTLIRDNHVEDVIQESAERHRMSEASLVQGQDPEMDEYLSSLEHKPVLLSLPVVHDAALISALDSLKAIRFSQGTTSVPATTTANASQGASASVQ